MHRIMLIEDDKLFIESILDNFEDENEYKIDAFTNSKAALKKLSSEKYDLILLDYFLKNDENGEKVLQQIRKINENIFVCLLTAYSEKITSDNAFKLGIQGYIDKDGDFKNIINGIKSSLHASLKSQEVRDKKTKKLFGVRLKNLRVKHNISQQDLATMIGLTRTAISNYEIGKTEPSFIILSKIATIFNTSTDYLIGRID